MSWGIFDKLTEMFGVSKVSAEAFTYNDNGTPESIESIERKQRADMAAKAKQDAVTHGGKKLKYRRRKTKKMGNRKHKKTMRRKGKRRNRRTKKR